MIAALAPVNVSPWKAQRLCINRSRNPFAEKSVVVHGENLNHARNATHRYLPCGTAGIDGYDDVFRTPSQRESSAAPRCLHPSHSRNSIAIQFAELARACPV